VIDVKLLRGTVASEFTKLRSVRSTYWCLILAVLLGIGLSCAISAGNASAYHSEDFSDRLHFDPTAFSLAGLFFAQLALGVFAILSICSEYSTGLIRTTLSAVPQRGYLLAAKAITAAGMAMVLSLITSFIAFDLGQLIFKHGQGGQVPYATLSDPGVLRAVLGSTLYIGGLVLLAIALGVIIRHTAGAITGLVALVFILPIVLQLLPGSWQHNLVRYLPAQAGSAITNVVPQGPNSLAPWTGFAVFMIEVAVLMAVGWQLLRTRDV
jgi:ABC-type transport system involved in multi-copper enzyme maturation permease subunit